MHIWSEGLGNSMGRLRNRILITLALQMMASAGAMRFDLQSGSSKCITEDINKNAMTVGKYSVINPLDGQPLPDSHKTTIRVTSPDGHHYHYADSVDGGDFAFTAAEGGNYITCFWAPEHKPPFTLSVDFDWKTGFAAKDWSKVAKKDQIEEMELELMKLLDAVTAIHDEMYYLREREEEMQVLNRATNSKMATFSFLSIFVCLCVAAMQLWHLKTFFERKKLI
ncbi:PREDICTED: transmembrane emp24 domain-containing protein p24delta9-like [Ipomoea nil]|uniref:transmembrane emp24 domain-containing protein p24delta9-like n=1 Tax=Ipomoea nil TaxID=35883 RepID=UPI000901BB83|nr:PREDICTED: transmembrane emp24 domain-containing protein p24delta9-like [Ipomoea nil]